MLQILFWILKFIVKSVGTVGFIRLADYLRKQMIIRTAPEKNLLIKYSSEINRFTSYALITGSTAGIGLEFGKRLAKAGFNLICISRSQEKLKQAEKEIRDYAIPENQQDKFKVVNIVRDFKESHKPNFFEELDEELKVYPIKILVNNVGFLSSVKKDDFSRPEYQEVIDLMNVNVISFMGLSKTLIPRMVNQRNEHGKGAVVFVSSMSASKFEPEDFVYGAAKKLMANMALVYAKKFHEKIDVLDLRPGWVLSNMTKEFEDKIPDMVEADDCVGSALNVIDDGITTSGSHKQLNRLAKIDFISWFVPMEWQVEEIWKRFGSIFDL